ncbi:MAG: hypothetical protein M3425_10620 [Actinomycetota bacterium]|nr:hypothetical protein [Actinomycetota bacterium]
MLDDNGVDGVSLGTLAIVDEGRPDPIRLARLPIPSYPLGAGVDQEAARVLAAVAPSVAGRLRDHRTWVRALARSAQAMPAYGAHEVGHGFVSRDTTFGYLRALTLRDVLKLVDHGAYPAGGWCDAPVADDRLE